jgi:hypothetical protein
MLRFSTAIVIFAGSLVSSWAGAADRYPFPALETSWSGTRVMEMGAATITSQVHQTPDKMRYETDAGTRVTVIHRQDLGVQWMLIDSATYLETSLSDLDSGSPEDGVLPEGIRIVEQEELGSRSIDGHDTRGYRVVTEDPEGQRADVETWVTGEGIPLLMTVATEHDGEPMTATIRTTEVRIGPQPDSLFEVPAGATKLDGASAAAIDMDGMMGGMTDILAEEARAGAEEGARDAVRGETRQRAEDALRKGFKKLFGN